MKVGISKCGCITAALAANATPSEIDSFEKRMRRTHRTVDDRPIKIAVAGLKMRCPHK